MSRIREREVSTRLIRPTLYELDVKQVLEMAQNFNPEWETDGKITVFDEGIAQYSLVDPISHSKFYAALILKKASLRCTVIDNEPNDLLETKNNTFEVINPIPNSYEANDAFNLLKSILEKRGYQFRD
ncbi:hypothetical protein M3Y97_00733300 [Aphelenchoides bicaudatus]|nr:hypothetical protein M3Y97_00733300 [Aphelenchoides bicaudatus]